MSQIRVDDLDFDHRFQYQDAIFQRHQGEEPPDQKIRCDRIGFVIPGGSFIPHSVIETEDFQPDTVVQLVSLTISPI